MLTKAKFTTTIALWIILFLQGNHLQAQSYFFERVYDETLAQASFVIGDLKTREAIVIDPKRDIDTYFEIAKANNLNITKVAETHIHADFLSGSRELAAVTGAGLFLSDEGGTDWQYQFPHAGLKDGSIIPIGQVELKLMHTPGHTPESLTFLVRDTKVPATPQRAITGDFFSWAMLVVLTYWRKQPGKSAHRSLAQNSFMLLFKSFPDCPTIWRYGQDTAQVHSAVRA